MKRSFRKICAISYMISLAWLSLSCSSQQRMVNSETCMLNTTKDVWVVNNPVKVEGILVVEKQVIILPGGVFEGDNTSKIVFTKPVNILSRERVFSTELRMESLPGVFTNLDITWWGANGRDEEDDTKAIQVVLDLASQSGCEQITIPIGQYIVSQQLRMAGREDNHQSLVIKGYATSFDGQHGSALMWNGGSDESMALVKNTSQTIFENIEFGAIPGRLIRSNIEFRPFCNQILFRSCSFGGCGGEKSCNINLNEGNNLQVSELIFENCIFKGLLTDMEYTDNGIRGGLANTKNFYFRNCSFGPYRHEAICITTSDILKVEDCTFYLNDVDIRCETCKTVAIGNYSEESGAFFESTASANFNATTLINNQFTGKPVDGYVIRDGSGTLLLMNNNFGAGNYLPDINRIRWEENEFNSIFSVGNVFKNTAFGQSPFYNRSNQVYRSDRVLSFGDLGGVLGEGRVKLPDSRN